MAKRAATPPTPAPIVRIRPELTPLLVALDSLKPFPQNPRRGDLAAITDSIRINGQYKAVLFRRATREIVAGNHVYFAMAALGAAEIAAQPLDIDEQQATRIVLADNQTSALGGFDDDRLAALLTSLPEPTLGTGFDQAALDELLASLTRTLPPAVPEPAAESEDEARGRFEITAKIVCPECGHAFAPP